MNKIGIAAVVVGLGLFASANYASAHEEVAICKMQTRQFISQAASGGWQTRELTGSEKIVALNSINSAPPVTQLRPGHLFVSAQQERGDKPALGMLIFADRDCITNIAGPTPLDVLMQFIGSGIGV